MIISIIGGSGFIGSRLAFLLKNKNIPFNIIDLIKSLHFADLSKIADITSPESLRDSINDDTSVIVNLAAEHRDDVSPRSKYYDVNVNGARNVCSIAEFYGINKIIFTSSVAVYGFRDSITNESGVISPFNDYGISKASAEDIYKLWFSKDPSARTLVIIRPTVVFGEGNRGNVYRLLKQISSDRFLMIGNGLNRKSLAYVENVAEFIEYSMRFKSGLYIFNYVDKPDFTMTSLVTTVKNILGKSTAIKFRLPFFIGFLIGYFFDFVTIVSKKKFTISAIRIKKFCSNSVYESAVESTGFIAPVPISEAIERTVKFEFLMKHKD